MSKALSMVPILDFYSGALSHQLNNELSVILGSLSQCENHLDPTAAKAVARAARSAKKISDLMKAQRYFLKQGSAEPFDARTCMEWITKLEEFFLPFTKEYGIEWIRQVGGIQADPEKNLKIENSASFMFLFSGVTVTILSELNRLQKKIATMVLIADFNSSDEMILNFRWLPRSEESVDFREVWKLLKTEIDKNQNLKLELEGGLRFKTQR